MTNLPTQPTKPELPIVIDSSLLTAFRACPAKFYYAHVLRRGGASETSVPLVAGGAFAAGLEEFRLAFYIDHEPFPVCLERAFIAAAIRWGDKDPFPPDKSGDHLIDARSLDRVMWSIARYFQTYDPRFDRLQPLPQQREGRTSFEYSFSYPLDDGNFILHPSGEPFLYAGRADTLGTVDRIPMFSDEKTTGAMGKTWAQQWPLRNQFIGYAWTMRRLGRPERACLVRGICILKNDTKFAESVCHFPDPMLDEWEQMLAHDLELMVAYYNSGFWPMRIGDACSSYGGCIYMGACQAPPRIRMNVLKTNYNENLWHPIETHERPKLLKEHY